MRALEFATTTLVTATILSFLVPSLVFAGAALINQTGNHFGEIPPLEYSIEYSESAGTTIVSASGIEYVPFSGPASHGNIFLPEKYFGNYPLYFSGSILHFAVHIKNIDTRTYRNLRIVVAEEYLNIDGGAGAPFPAPAIMGWFVGEIRPGEEVVLPGSMPLPNFGPSGIDQTHLQILHWDGKEGDKTNVGSGRVIIDDPQAGLWCPLRQS